MGYVEKRYVDYIFFVTSVCRLEKFDADLIEIKSFSMVDQSQNKRSVLRTLIIKHG